jgi:hypothetical protein
LRTYLPIVPTTALRRHRVSEPFDTRFRACARLLQSVWRAAKGLPIGTYSRPSGETHRLGSMISDRAGDMGANFLLPEIARLARREVAYREPGALIEERRLWCNLLSSMPLTFNLLGLLRLDPKLATKVLRAMFPDLEDAKVEAVLFEHSPGRGVVDLTGDHTAFDAMIVYGRPDGSRGFVAIEVKYSESRGEPHRELRPRYAELAPLAAIHREPGADYLTNGPLQQFYRQHLLAQATLMRGDYSEGRFLVIAPELNTPVQAALVLYSKQLLPSEPAKVGFTTRTLEEVIDLIRQCGERGYANALRERYCDWAKVDAVIEEAIAEFGRDVTVGNDNPDAQSQAA